MIIICLIIFVIKKIKLKSKSKQNSYHRVLGKQQTDYGSTKEGKKSSNNAQISMQDATSV